MGRRRHRNIGVSVRHYRLGDTRYSPRIPGRTGIAWAIFRLLRAMTNDILVHADKQTVVDIGQSLAGLPLAHSVEQLARTG